MWKEKKTLKMTMTLAGPTCDSVDTIYDEIELPINIDYNDIVYFINTGAYTSEYATYFNGIEPIKVYTIEELEHMLQGEFSPINENSLY